MKKRLWSICLAVSLLGVIGAIVSFLVDNALSVMLLLLSVIAILGGALAAAVLRMFKGSKKYSKTARIFAVTSVCLQVLLAAVISVELIPWGALLLLAASAVISLRMKTENREFWAKTSVVLLATVTAYPLHYLLSGLLI